MKSLLNCSFNLNMCQDIDQVSGVETFSTPVSKEKFLELLDSEKPENYLGHPALASILKTELGREFEAPRGTLKLSKGVHTIFIAQYIGARLPEGTAQLPENARIVYVVETVEIH